MPRKKDEVTVEQAEGVVDGVALAENPLILSRKCVLVSQADFITEQLPKIPSEVLCSVLGLKDLSMGAMSDRDTMVELIDGQFSRVVRPAQGSSPPPPPKGDEDD